MKLLLMLIIIAGTSSSVAAAQSPAEQPKPQPSQITENHPVIALPGKLDCTEVFNSNSPEVVQGDGILLSTFPPAGRSAPDAHLNHELNGRVDFFLHQINNRIKAGDEKTVQLALIVQNNGQKPAHVRFISGASYLSQPDAPFVDLPASLANDAGNVYAGPGDRVANDIINERRDKKYFPDKMVIQPGHYAILFQAPVPVVGLQPPLNGRTTLFKIQTDQPLFAALLDKITDPQPATTSQSAPQQDGAALDAWVEMLKTSSLVEPREKPPTPLNADSIIYGRVAGVAKGSSWNGSMTNDKCKKYFEIKRDQVVSTVISTLAKGTFGTEQIQSAPLVCRYGDTALSAHGNYGIWYKIGIPFRNVDTVPVDVTITLDTPIKNDLNKNSLQFFDQQAKQVFFRGTVRVTTTTGDQKSVRSTHLVEHRGEKGDPVLELQIDPGENADVKVDFVYPADATPPQALTIRTERSEKPDDSAKGSNTDK